MAHNAPDHCESDTDGTPTLRQGGAWRGLLRYCPSHSIPSQSRRYGHARVQHERDGRTDGLSALCASLRTRIAGRNNVSPHSPSAVTSRRRLPNLDTDPGSVRADNATDGERFRGRFSSERFLLVSRRDRRLDCHNDPDPGGGVRVGGLVRHLPGGYSAQGEGCGPKAHREPLGGSAAPLLSSPLPPPPLLGRRNPAPPPASGLPASPPSSRAGHGQRLARERPPLPCAGLADLRLPALSRQSKLRAASGRRAHSAAPLFLL